MWHAHKHSHDSPWQLHSRIWVHSKGFLLTSNDLQIRYQECVVPKPRIGAPIPCTVGKFYTVLIVHHNELSCRYVDIERDLHAIHLVLHANLLLSINSFYSDKLMATRHKAHT